MSHALVIDWGVGGLDAWARLRAQHPTWSTTYISDAGHAPYGTVSAPALAQRLVALTETALALPDPPDLCVIACNALSTVLAPPPGASPLSTTAEGHPLPLPTLGIIDAGLRVALASGLTRLGVIGGALTITSALHARALHAAGRTVTTAVAQPLSAHVEAGRLSGPEVRADVEAVLAALSARGPAPQGLLLACTHYPALSPLLSSLWPEVRLLDPVDGLLETTLHLPPTATASSPAPTHRVLTSGDPDAMRRAARLAFGLTLPPTIAPLMTHS